MRSSERSTRFSGRALIALFVALVLHPWSHNKGLFGSFPGFENPSSLKSDLARSQSINAQGLRLLDRGQIGMAVEKFRLAIALDPGNIEALNNLAVAMEKGRNAQGALPAFHRALRLDPKNPKLHSNLALALRRSGRSHEAARSWRQRNPPQFGAAADGNRRGGAGGAGAARRDFR